MSSFPCILRAWNAYENELRQFLRHRCQDTFLADDLLQEVFVKAMKQGRQFCVLDNSRAWLYQVARNALIDEYRVRRKQVEMPDDISQEIEIIEPIHALSKCVVRVLAELSPEDRQIIEACDLNSVKQKSYAEQHGLFLAAVKSRLLRAREKMRRQMRVACQVKFDEQGLVADHLPRG